MTRSDARKRTQATNEQAGVDPARLDAIERIARERVGTFRDVMLAPETVLDLIAALVQVTNDRDRWAFDHSVVEHWQEAAKGWEWRHNALAAKLARVEALADKWEGDRLNTAIDKEAAAYAIRDALDGDQP